MYGFPQVALSKDGVTEVHGLGTLSDVEKAGLEVTGTVGRCRHDASASDDAECYFWCHWLSQKFTVFTQGLKSELQGSIQKGIDFVAKRS